MADSKKAVKWRRSSFGLYADYSTRPECGVVVVCVNGGSHMQLHPIAVLLPHQIYKDRCSRWLKEHDATEIVVLPVVGDYVTVMSK